MSENNDPLSAAKQALRDQLHARMPGSDPDGAAQAASPPPPPHDTGAEPQPPFKHSAHGTPPPHGQVPPWGDYGGGPSGGPQPPPWMMFANPAAWASWFNQPGIQAWLQAPWSAFSMMPGAGPPQNNAASWFGQANPFAGPGTFFQMGTPGQAGPAASPWAPFFNGFQQFFGATQAGPPQGPGAEFPFGFPPNPVTTWFQSLFAGLPNMPGFSGMPWPGHARTASTNAGDGEPRHTPLITLRSEGQQRPLFCIHALLGSAFQFHKLANLLSEDQPCYALQARGLDTGEKPLDKIEDLAAFYLPYIRNKQPQGPYRLVGYSLGAWIALEIARLLQAVGEKTELLLMVGGTLPLSMHYPGHLWNPEYLHKYFTDYRDTFITSFLPYEERMKAKSNGFNPTQQVYLAHFSAMLRYRPQPFRGGHPAVLATPDQQWVDQWVNPNGWRDIFPEPVAFYPITGNHLSMMEAPHIEEVAAVVRQQLAALG